MHPVLSSPMLIQKESLTLHTPIGVLCISGTEDGVSQITSIEDESCTQSSLLTLQSCAQQISEYFTGKRTVFDSLELHYPATGFQDAVWNTLINIPFGETISYSDLAEQAGYKGASRAVGTAMKVNPLPIIIPCHRVIPSSGGIGEYVYGSIIKQWLLDHEKNIQEYRKAACRTGEYSV